MKQRGRAGVGIIVVCAVWCGFAPGANGADLPLPFGNLINPPVTTTNQLTNTAAMATPGYAVTNGNVNLTFRGAFTPASVNTRLAIQSDDGSDVYINGVQKVFRKNVETHWQNVTLGNSACALSIIDYTFTNTDEYCIYIDYHNNVYTPGDTDGVTLYAWNDGGQVRNGIAVWGANFAPIGCSATLHSCGTITNWSVNPTGIVSLSGSGDSITVQGISNGTATVTAFDSDGRFGSRPVKVIKLGVSPKSFTNCQGIPITLVLTNSEVTNGVVWTHTGTGSVSDDSRTNILTYSTPGTNKLVTATWNSFCSASATGVVVGVASLNVTPPRLCGSGQATFTATSTPPGYESMLSWSGDGVSGNGAQQIVNYTTPGVKSVTVSCGTSQQTIGVTVHHIDITNVFEYGLAGSTVPVVFGLSSNSFGPYLWTVEPASGPSFVGGTQGSTASILPGNNAGTFTVRAEVSFFPSCTDTATLQVVQATFSGGDIALCKGGSSNLTVTVNPPSAISLLSFDTVTNATVGPSNTHAHVTIVNGTNLTVHGVEAGTAYLRVRLGNNMLIGPTIQIVSVTFPAEPFYVGVGKTADYSVTIVPTNATVTFDTVSNSIATATAIVGGVRLSGVAPGTTQVRASVGGGMVCSTQNVTAIRVFFSTIEVLLCAGDNRTVGVEVDPPGSPVTYVPTTNLTIVSVQGTNVTITAQSNVVGTVVAKVGSATMDKLLVRSLTVRFPSNPWYAAPGGDQPFTVEVEPPKLAPYVNFISLNPNIATVTAGGTPRSLVVHGVSDGTAEIRAWVGETNHVCHNKVVNVLSPTIASVQWFYLNGSPITDVNDNPALGLRYFPDSPLPGAGPSNQVLIRVTVSPPLRFANAVHIRVFDVDDPSSTNAPLDDEALSSDNKGAAHTPPSSAAFSTDTNGIVDAIMTLSMQPGNNFRAVAATNAGYFNDVGARQNDGLNASVTNSSGAIPGNQISPLLTVWRKLHIEVDSMGPVVSNLVKGNIIGLFGFTNTATELALDVHLRTSLTPTDNSPNLTGSTNRGRFENGWIRIGSNLVLTSGLYGNGDSFVRNPTGFSIPAEIVSGGSTISAGQVIDLLSRNFTITANLGAASYSNSTFRVAGTVFTITGNTTNTVTVSTDPQIPFVLHDDDDDTVLPRLPDVSGMAAKWQPAYILPLFNTGFDSMNDPFHLNSDLNQDDAHWAEGRGSRKSTASYWVVMVKNAFQATVSGVANYGDNDPNHEGTWRAAADLDAESVLMCEESTRDWIAAPTNSTLGGVYVGGGGGVDPNPTGAPGRQPRRQETLNHEIGHLFGLDGNHWEGEPSPAGSVYGDVMRDALSRQSSDFGVTSLHVIRQKSKPGN